MICMKFQKEVKEGTKPSCFAIASRCNSYHVSAEGYFQDILKTFNSKLKKMASTILHCVYKSLDRFHVLIEII